VAQADLDTAVSNASALRAGVQSAQGAVEQSKASLHQAEINLAYTSIVSPIDGVVISRNVDVGQTVAASLQAPTLFTIAEDLTRMQVDTNVAEADIGKLTPGMETSFTVDAYPGAPFKGRIRQIRNAPLTVQNVVTYDAVIDVANPDLKLKPGMTATVTAIWAQSEDALRVPNASLRFRPTPDLLAADSSAAGSPTAAAGEGHRRGGRGPKTSEGAATDPALPATPPVAPTTGGPAKGSLARQVYVLRPGRLEAVPVQTGITDGSFTEILGGALKEGEPVVTETTGLGTETPKSQGGSPLGPQPAPGGGGVRRLL
jgi:HlyD family secretion protein